MKLTRGRKIVPISSKAQQPDDSEIPFVPAYDLLEKSGQSLTHSEAMAIALALYELVPDEKHYSTAWERVARFDSISTRNI
jgi:hypothetical protein